ncbi:SDR family oxidoreductase [uncultured Winogradskyella sp.]|uniref:SDR family oxidoreductase n=1 Tax=uncultured Winogradskyella sp. TaxID=395353 RepID=UPI0026076B6C|nr:SDR family oxidoreductase [uncultured Winogradskyella sp.]|tara:strand:- start:30815 stop:31456 length:642 start_codon:yes stop_codon:yes gene_type:complete
MENILVAGANGTTGKQIVNLLKASQYFNPIAMVRKEAQLDQFKADGVETVLADLTKDLTHAVKGVDKVLFAAGSGGRNVVEVDQEGAKRLMAVSKMANVKKFVMLSTMGADNPQAVEGMEDYMKAKQNADEYLRSNDLNYTIIRPGTLNNSQGKGKIELSEKLNKQGEISRADVAQTLVRALHDDAPNNSTFEIIQGNALIGEAMNELNMSVN